jgi:sialic acid synthase SpsE
MRIGGLDTDDRVVVIAEIGNNHEGSLEVARALIEQAALAGVDAVKFQTFRTERYVSRGDEARFSRLESFRIPDEAFAELAALAREHGLAFISTPFDLDSARVLAGFVDCLKISSGDNTFYPLLDVAAASGKPLIVSTGLATLEQLDRTVAFVESRAFTTRELALLHCVSSYPVPENEVGLRAIGVLGERFPGWTVGYSDHTIQLDAAVLAVAAGARIVEKHFTLDKQFSDFRDHQLSADPPELELLVQRIRAAETMLGLREKRVQPSEEAGTVTMRRSIVAARDLPAGHELLEDDLTWVRPGGGLRPGEESKLVGKALRRSVTDGERLEMGDVE